MEIWVYYFFRKSYFWKRTWGFAIAAYNDFYNNKSYGDLVIDDYFTHNHPHNFIIQFMVEWEL